MGNVYESGVKSNNAYISPTYNGWIDLFGWGTSGWNSGANCYQPWSTSQSYSDYYPGGVSTNSLSGAFAEADWAWHNPISNGGNAIHKWRTLTASEWSYLFFNRLGALTKYGTGTVNGVHGVIILPDNWSLPEDCMFNAGGIGQEVEENWSNNSYTLQQWASMEEAGAVFLPCAGYRAGDNLTYINRYGWYWSSSRGYYNKTAYQVFIRSYNVYVSNGNLINDNRDAGHSVRPVRDID